MGDNQSTPERYRPPPSSSREIVPRSTQQQVIQSSSAGVLRIQRQQVIVAQSDGVTAIVARLQECTISVSGGSNRGPAGCTFEKHGRESISQSWYECYTCWGGESQYGCCAACARSCHSGHELVPGQTRTDVCDCGKNSHQKVVCTWHSTKKNYIRQPFYRCYDCFSDAIQGCCYQCSKSCHSGHNTRYAGVMKAFCDCGLEGCSTTCKIASPKN